MKIYITTKQFIFILALILIALLLIIPGDGTLSGVLGFIGLSAVALIARYLYLKYRDKVGK